MLKRIGRILMMTAATLAVGLACSLASSLPGSGSEETDSTGTTTDSSPPPGGDAAAGTGAVVDNSAGSGGSTGDPAVVSAPTAADSARPVPLGQGLASLNSYRLTTSTRSTGPTKADRNDMDIVTDYSNDMDSRFTRTSTVSSSEDYPELAEDVSEQYRVGNESCSLSSGEWEYDAMTPLEREGTELFQSFIDIVPVIENPTFVDEVNLNGVMTNHYQFQVSGLGTQSGALVTQSDGEYWSAQDGNYLVKYQLVMELRSGPEGDAAAEVVRGEFNIELTQINQPVTVSLPAECLAVRDQQ